MKQEFYSVKDLMILLNCKKTKAYTIIRKLNEELEEKGLRTIKGRILKSYFDDQYGLSNIKSKDQS